MGGGDTFRNDHPPRIDDELGHLTIRSTRNLTRSR
ncbi:MAG: hypothetical protein QOK39_1232, partial [Acidimicrobiaceae bacterium]|nr:hypothetical protein [Acidimicrobiaceae bacterium]